MKKTWIWILLAAFLLSACGIGGTQTEPTAQPLETIQPTQAPTETTQATEPATVPTTQPPETTEATRPEHSELYIPDLSVEDVILYFNEVCLDAEYVEDDSNVSVIQKWQDTIFYFIEGPATEQDMEVLERFCAWLNEIPGFPGILPTDTAEAAGLRIHFCLKEEIPAMMGDNFQNSDGGVNIWWYLSNNQIYDGTICCATDIDQYVRNSVILEEIFNGLGPLQDTQLRPDSISYSGFSTPQELTPVDALILKLLYHPDIRGGMSAEECEQVIRQLYY